MKCPICGKTVQLHDAEMPFCSERCRVIDLGNWASEKYVIPVPLESEQDLEGGGLLPSNEEDGE